MIADIIPVLVIGGIVFLWVLMLYNLRSDWRIIEFESMMDERVRERDVQA